MRNLKLLVDLPRYSKKSLSVCLPDKVRDWSHGNSQSMVLDSGNLDKLYQHVRHFNKKKAWRWPKRQYLFFSDLHGDADAFVDSLLVSGGVEKTGKKLTDFVLTKPGKKALFIIGGDCFDKGPSSLTLLRTIRHLIDVGGDVEILAGNHDVRVLLGMESVGKKPDIYNEHFFIRTGEKIVPLLKEIVEQYIDGHKQHGLPSRKLARQKLFPRADWFERFPELAEPYLLPEQINREMQRIRRKLDRFEKVCEKHGLDIAQVCAATQKWKQLFLEPDGEFYWFYQRMRLALQAGSLLFVHAGLDNVSARMLHKQGVDHLNKAFRKALHHKPFNFYYGPLCNMIRTKYREVDHPLTAHGTRHIRRAGITAVVHGHRNLYHGQRIALRKGLLSFECDVTLDKNSRHKEGLKGCSAGVTIIEPKGYILGISADYPYAKFFHPELTLKQIHKQLKKR